MALKFDQKKLDKFKEDELADKRIFTKLQEEVSEVSKVDQADRDRWRFDTVGNPVLN
jgi:hypothetical protein